MTKKFTYKHYDLTEDEMQALITQAQAGDTSAQLELLTIFQNFLGKYTALLYHAKYSLGDYDVRRFLALFVKDKSVRQYLIRNKLNAAGHKHVGECIRGIQYMCQRLGTEEDVDQTVTMAFLHTLQHYQRRGKIPFSGYLYAYFFFVLKKQVDALLIDQLGRKTFPLLDSGEEYDPDDDSLAQGYPAPPVPGVDEMLGAEVIDEYWVAGDTVGPPFDVLTIQERQLLRWRYVERERSSDIAARITEHPNTVREHFNRIRGKLRDAIAKDIGW